MLLCVFSVPAARCALVRQPCLALLECVHHCLRPDCQACWLLCIALLLLSLNSRQCPCGRGGSKSICNLHPPPMLLVVLQCCMGAILEAAQRGSHKEVMSGLHNARAGVLSLLPAIAGEHRQLPTLALRSMLTASAACFLTTTAANTSPSPASAVVSSCDGLVTPLPAPASCHTICCCVSTSCVCHRGELQPCLSRPVEAPHAARAGGCVGSAEGISELTTASQLSGHYSVSSSHAGRTTKCRG